MMPEADEATLLLATGNAIRSRGYLGALETVATRSEFFARRNGRSISFDDVESAIAETWGDDDRVKLGSSAFSPESRIKAFPSREAFAEASREVCEAEAGYEFLIEYCSQAVRKCSEIGREVHECESLPSIP
jgi:hypothetical protein